MRAASSRAVERLADLNLDGYDVFLVQAEELAVEAKGGRVEALTRSAETGLGLRAVVGSRVGATYTLDLSPKGIDRAVDQARALAALSTPEPAFSLSPPPPDLPEVEAADLELARLPQEAKIELALEMEKAALAFDERVVKVRRASYEEGHARTRLINSLGLDLFREETLCQASATVLAREGEESQMGWDFSFSPFFNRLEATRCAEKAAAQAVGLLGARKAPSGFHQVVLNNLVASEILSVLAPAFLAENVQKGKSLLAGRTGKKLFSPQLNLIDDGLYPFGVGSRPFDDEGVPQQRTDLVREGRLKGFLYDRLAAAREGQASTGNARRGSVKSPPLSGATNLFIEPKEGQLDQLVAQIDEGLLITEVMGLHTADPISGEFSLGAAGFWLKGGQKAYPVRGAAFSGNLIDLFARVVQVGADLRFLGRVGSPSLIIQGLDVAG